MRKDAPRRRSPRGQMIQMLRRGWERVRERRQGRTQKLTAGDPTRVCVEIADDEGGNGRAQAALHGGELPGLAHADGLCAIAKFLAEQFVIGLSVGVDEPDSPGAAGSSEFDTEPALGGELVQSRCVQIRILSGVYQSPCRSRPGEGETGSEQTGNVTFTSGTEEHPPRCSKSGGPRGLPAPDLLKGDDVRGFCEPRDDFLDGGITPRKSTDVVTHEAKGVHYLAQRDLLLCLVASAIQPTKWISSLSNFPARSAVE